MKSGKLRHQKTHNKNKHVSKLKSTPVAELRVENS